MSWRFISRRAFSSNFTRVHRTAVDLATQQLAILDRVRTGNPWTTRQKVRRFEPCPQVPRLPFPVSGGDPVLDRIDLFHHRFWLPRFDLCNSSLALQAIRVAFCSAKDDHVNLIGMEFVMFDPDVDQAISLEVLDHDPPEKVSQAPLCRRIGGVNCGRISRDSVPFRVTIVC